MAEIFHRVNNYVWDTGTSEWVKMTQPSGSGTIMGTIADTQIAFGTGADTIGGFGAWDGTTLTVPGILAVSNAVDGDEFGIIATNTSNTAGSSVGLEAWTTGDAATGNSRLALGVHADGANAAEFEISVDGNSGNNTPTTTFSLPGNGRWTLAGPVVYGSETPGTIETSLEGMYITPNVDGGAGMIFRNASGDAAAFAGVYIQTTGDTAEGVAKLQLLVHRDGTNEAAFEIAVAGDSGDAFPATIITAPGDVGLTALTTFDFSINRAGDQASFLLFNTSDTAGANATLRVGTTGDTADGWAELDLRVHSGGVNEAEMVLALTGDSGNNSPTAIMNAPGSMTVTLGENGSYNDFTVQNGAGNSTYVGVITLNTEGGAYLQAGTDGDLNTGDALLRLRVHENGVNEAQFTTILAGDSGNATPDTTFSFPGAFNITGANRLNYIDKFELDAIGAVLIGESPEDSIGYQWWATYPMVYLEQITGGKTPGFIGNVWSTVANDASGFFPMRSRGTKTVPTAVQSGDNLGVVEASGFDGNNNYQTCGSFQFRATENFSTNHWGTQAVLKVTPANSSSFLGASYEFTDTRLTMPKAAQLTATTFANAITSPAEGAIQAFTDSSTAVWGATITGGGANHVLGYYNGTNWTVIGK